jgi:hypothetical protein
MAYDIRTTMCRTNDVSNDVNIRTTRWRTNDVSNDVNSKTTGQSDGNWAKVRLKPDGRQTNVRQKTLRIMFPLSSVAMAMA